jgi:hypothetical protein
MKHLIKNNKIVMSGIPASFTRENGESFWGGYQNRTDLHYADGWRDEVIPAFDPLTQRLGEPYYDILLKKVTYPVIERDINLEELYHKRIREFEQFQKEFRREITELFLEEIALGTMSDQVKGLIMALQQRKTEIMAELEGFYDTGNIERLVNYSFYTPETEQFKQALVALK